MPLAEINTAGVIMAVRTASDDERASMERTFYRTRSAGVPPGVQSLTRVETASGSDRIKTLLEHMIPSLAVLHDGSQSCDILRAYSKSCEIFFGSIHEDYALKRPRRLALMIPADRLPMWLARFNIAAVATGHSNSECPQTTITSSIAGVSKRT